MAKVSKIILAVAILAVAVPAQTQKLVKNDAYNRMATIKGHIEFLDSSGLERVAGTGQFVIFQRDGCADCLIGVYADANGDYKTRVGRGRYKLIAYNPSPPTYDLIAPSQAKYVDAIPGLQDIQFDIKLILRSER